MKNLSLFCQHYGKKTGTPATQAGFALAIVLLTLFLLGVIGAYLATGFGSRDTEVQNRAAVVQDVVTSVLQVKNVVDTCAATQSGKPDGVKGAPTFSANVNGVTGLVPNYPFGVDAPTNPASAQCNVQNATTSTVPVLFGWASNICCLRDPSTGSRAAYNPWIAADASPPAVNQSALFANPAQPDSSWAAINSQLSANVTSYSSADGLLVVAYANNKGDIRNSYAGSSGVALAIKPAEAYIGDASMNNLMQSITDRLNNLGLSAFYCSNSDPYYYRTVLVRLYRQPGTFVDPCPGSTNTATVPVN
jgi:hypothetical protein